MVGFSLFYCDESDAYKWYWANDSNMLWNVKTNIIYANDCKHHVRKSARVYTWQWESYFHSVKTSPPVTASRIKAKDLQALFKRNTDKVL